MHAQDPVLQRIILIGDAGEMDAIQKAVIANAAEKILAGKTSVIYLSDNIYPTVWHFPARQLIRPQKKFCGQSLYQCAIKMRQYILYRHLFFMASSLASQSLHLPDFYAASIAKLNE